MKLSFVIPAKNESGNITPLYKELSLELRKIKLNYEVIFVDDGSTDKTFEEMSSLRKQDSKIKIIRLRGNWGKSLALMAGFEATTGDIIFTMDADLQDNPKEIKKFLQKLEEGNDIVSGWKKVRHDPPSKVIPSRIFNFLVTKLTGVKVHDTNCGFKAYKKEVIKSLKLYGELYRFIPVIAAKQNYIFAEIPVEHRARTIGKSKFGMERHVKGFLDLVTIVFLTGYMRRPGHFFGKLGLASFTAGFVIGLYITYLRMTTGTIQDRHPLLFLGMLLMIIGVQLISTGLIAELIVHFHQPRSTENYVAEKII